MEEEGVEAKPIAPADPVMVSRVAFKAPPFWDSDPELWFLQVESQFVVANITLDSTKFHAVVAALNTQVLNCVKDIIRQPPAQNAYVTLKDRVLQHFAQTESSKLNLLLKDLQLGSKRPSHLLNEMENLASKSMDQEMLRMLWSQRLPANVQQILSVCKAPLPELALIADKILDVSDNAVPLSAISNNDSGLIQLTSEIADLKKLILRSRRFRSNSRVRHGRSREARSTSKASEQAKRFCWYHFRFGKNAKKCIDPCAWTEN